MQLSRRPSLPPHPHPQRGRGKKQGEGSAAGPRAAEPERGGGSPGRGRPGSGRREATGLWLPSPAHSLAPGSNRRSTDPGTWLEFSAIKVHLVWGATPTPRSPGKSGSSGSPRGSGRSRGSPLAPPAPHRPRGSAGRLGTGEGEKAGRAKAPACPSPSLPSPAGGSREEGAVGRALAECRASELGS